MPEAKKGELRRVYVDIPDEQDRMLAQLALDARISKKRFLELLIEKSFRDNAKKTKR